MNEKISIILPIFNVGAHLRGGIDSLINQTIGNENLEIIMVNDCSTDGSGDVIDEYSDTIDYYIDITNDFCSVYSAINLSKNGEYISCQLNDDKFRFFKRITKNGEHTFVEKYATIDNAIEIIEEMFKVDDLHENDDDEIVDVDIEL